MLTWQNQMRWSKLGSICNNTKLLWTERIILLKMASSLASFSLHRRSIHFSGFFCTVQNTSFFLWYLFCSCCLLFEWFCSNLDSYTQWRNYGETSKIIFMFTSSSKFQNSTKKAWERINFTRESLCIYILCLQSKTLISLISLLLLHLLVGVIRSKTTSFSASTNTIKQSPTIFSAPEFSGFENRNRKKTERSCSKLENQINGEFSGFIFSIYTPSLMKSNSKENEIWSCLSPALPQAYPSTFDTIAMESDLKNKIKSDLESFLKSEQYYNRRSIRSRLETELPLVRTFQHWKIKLRQACQGRREEFEREGEARKRENFAVFAQIHLKF